MSEHEEQESKPIPFGQIIFDDLFLLLLAGLVVPFIIYTVWGLMDIGSIPPLPATEFEGAVSVSNQAQTPEVEGAKLAQSKGCLGCHSIDGAAMVGPTWQGLYGASRVLADGNTVAVDDAYLIESIEDPGAKIVEGFLAGVMPPYAGQFSSDEINALIAYIKSLQ